MFIVAFLNKGMPQMQPIATDVALSIVCLSVCCQNTGEMYKAAEPIEYVWRADSCGSFVRSFFAGMGPTYSGPQH